MMTKEQNKTIAFTAIGGALEFYDFTIYALFASYISEHFFPAQNPLIGLIYTFIVFALGYLARPLGGIIFGYIGDKFGLKSAFALSIIVMATSTLLIGCLPDYHHMGIISPLCLIILQFLQGFSIVGEIPGAAIFTIEHVPYHKRGFAIGLVFMGIILGNSIGASIGLLLTFILTHEQISVWGWRIPFILGFFFGIISYVIRSKAHETSIFLSISKEGFLKRRPFLQLIKTSRRQILKGFLLTAIPASTLSLFLYMPTYLCNILQENVPHVYFITLMALISFALMTGFFGWGSDFISRKKLLIAGTLLFIISSYPLFCGLARLGGSFVWIFALGFSIFSGMVNGCYIVLIAECFPTSVRYAGVGLSYSLGVAVFGGLAPLAFTWLIQIFHMLEAPALYLLGSGILTLSAILIKERRTCSEMSSKVTC